MAVLTRSRIVAAAAALSIAIGAAWSGCGSEDAVNEVQGGAQKQVEKAQQQVEEAGKQAQKQVNRAQKKLEKAQKQLEQNAP